MEQQTSSALQDIMSGLDEGAKRACKFL
jgi:hypothetical protein